MAADGKTVWIVDDDRSIRWVLERALQQAGMEAACFDSGDAALDELQRRSPDVLISDIRMPGTDGLELLSLVQAEHPRLPVIIMTAHSDLDSAVSSYQSGAFEYLPKPFDVDEAVSVVDRALAYAHEQERADEVTKPAPAKTEPLDLSGAGLRCSRPAQGTGAYLPGVEIHCHRH